MSPLVDLYKKYMPTKTQSQSSSLKQLSLVAPHLCNLTTCTHHNSSLGTAITLAHCTVLDYYYPYLLAYMCISMSNACLITFSTPNDACNIK